MEHAKPNRIGVLGGTAIRTAIRPGRGSPSLLDRYCEQLGNFATRRHREAALLAAKIEAEDAADVARAAMVRAQSADRAKSEFLAMMSHELRTPLNAIIGFAEMIALGITDPGQSDKHEEYARDILGSGRHLLGVINDILDLTKIEAGQLDLNEQPVDPAACAEVCVRIVRDLAEQKRLSIDLRIAADSPRLVVDERKFKQILLNLLSNAIKFTPPGGKVVVSAEFANPRGPAVIISDSGIGVAVDKIEAAFEPFTQLDAGLNRAHEGTGLGLPLSRALTELHGGFLDMISVPGAGTTVTVRLPPERLLVDAA